MKTKHIVVKLHRTDTYIPESAELNTLTVSLDQTDESKMLKTTLFAELDRLKLVPNNIMFDFINFALALYAIDQVVSRQLNGFQGWSRHLIVYFPVHEPVAWNNVKADLEKYIGFLSGDKWEFRFRENQQSRTIETPVESNPDGYKVVSLLSGGLDSFIGAVDLLSEQMKPYFVSHYKTSENKIQENITASLGEKFGKSSFASLKIWVQPNQKNENAEKEKTSRARSLLFITLGLAVANSLGNGIKLILPENGLISLNIPLTLTRLSSHSTRTTHPYFVNGLNTILSNLGITNQIENPYRFKTKGEMMIECKDVEFLQQHYSATVSCSHPENSRYAGLRPGLNCGYCVPCIIRQAAENKTGDIKTEYATEDIRSNPPSNKSRKGADYRAFRLALTRLDNLSPHQSKALQIIRSGPLPYFSTNELEEYVSMYYRGMAEVKLFLMS